MSIEIEFVGAAQEVTGSRHIVHTANANILLDCGMFQGRRAESRQRNQELGFAARDIDVCILSHAHIDHSGALPILCKNGFPGTIYATPATRDLCALMLQDAAMIQIADARYLNRKIEEGELDSDPVVPLYDTTDVARTMQQMVSIPYNHAQVIAPGVTLKFLDAGHVLGSAIVVLDIEDEGETKRLVFSGDLGRPHLPILRDPQVPDGARALIMESTYGDRLHSDVTQMDDELASIITRVHKRRGKIVIPSFALERAQEIIFSLKKLRDQKRIPAIPVYVDSPLAINITQVFRMHPECFDEEIVSVLQNGGSPFDFEGLHYTSTVADSMNISRSDEPSIVIASSGMCEAGRVLHHLKATIENEKNAVVIVGFQAEHTLGRRIAERRSRVRVLGVERDLRAEVAVLDGFSAHADQAGLIAFARQVAERGALQWTALVHGEPRPQNVLGEKLVALGLSNVSAPKSANVLKL